MRFFWRRWLIVLLLLCPSLAWSQQGLLINGSRTLAGTLNAATTTGTGTAYLMNLDPAITNYVVNQCFTFRAHVANTGAATLNVNGVAIRPLKKYVGTVQQDLVAGDITAGQIVLTCYDGAVMQMVGAGFAGGGGGGIGYTAENVVNKATAPGLGTSDTAYPSQNAVKTYVDTGLAGKQGTLGFAPENTVNKAPSTALGTSNTAYPTQGAVKSYVDTGLAAKQATLGFTPENALNKSPTPTLGTSDILYPTQHAVKTYVDSSLAALPPATGGGTDGLVNASSYGVVCDGSTITWNALQTALNTIPTGTKLVLPSGECLLDQPLIMSRVNIALLGAGVNATTLKQTVPTLPVLHITAPNVDVTDFSLVHSTNPSVGGDGLVVRGISGQGLQQVNITNIHAHHNYRGFVLGCVAYAVAHRAWATWNNSHGFEFLYDAAPGCGVQQWEVVLATSQLNLGVGFFGHNQLTTPQAVGPWISQSMSFSNMQGGYVFQGSPGGFGISDLRFHDNLSSSDNVAGMYLNTFGYSHTISNFWAEYVGELGGFPVGFNQVTSVASQTGHCLGIGPDNAIVSIMGGIYWACAWSGVAIDAPYTSFVGGASQGNGVALDANLARRAGLHIGATGVTVSGHTFHYSTANAPATLHYIHLYGFLDQVAIGTNTYMPNLPETAFVHTTEAVLPGTMLGTVLEPAEREQAAGALMGEYIYSGCLPSIQAGSLILGSFACTGFVHDTTVTPPRLRPVRQAGSTVGPLSSADGTYWLALHLDATGAVAGWNRHPGTHYLWAYGTNIPPQVPRGQIIAKITVAGLVITAVEDFRVPVSYRLHGTYDVTDPLYGGVADDTTDVGPAVQKAMNAAGAQKGRIVRIPQGVYALRSPIVINASVTLQGDGWGPTVFTERGGGTWLHISDPGFVPITINAMGSAVKNVAFDHDQPPPGAGWAPLDYPNTILVGTGLSLVTTDIELENLFFQKATRGIACLGSGIAQGRIHIQNVSGQFFLSGIWMDLILDVVRIEDVHMWPYWTADTNVLLYQANNLLSLTLFRCDGCLVKNFFSFASHIGLNFAQGPNGGINGFLGNNILFDGAAIGLLHAQSTGGTASIVNFNTNGFSTALVPDPGYTTSTGVFLAGTAAYIDIVNFYAVNLAASCASVNGTSNNLTLNNAQCLNWNLSNTGFPALTAAAGNTLKVHGAQNIASAHDAPHYAGPIAASVLPGGAIFNAIGDFFAAMIGNRSTLAFAPNAFIQWYPEGNAFILGAPAGTYNTGGVRKYLCIEDGVLTVGSTCP